jgi:hypothetical protein
MVPWSSFGNSETANLPFKQGIGGWKRLFGRIENIRAPKPRHDLSDVVLADDLSN